MVKNELAEVPILVWLARITEALTWLKMRRISEGVLLAVMIEGKPTSLAIACRLPPPNPA